MAEETDQPKIDSESARIIMDTAAREYTDENDRGKQLDGKTAPLIAATGAIMLFVAGTLSRPPALLPAFWQGVYFAGVCVTLCILACSEVSFLRVLWIRDYHRLQLDDLVNMKRCCLEPSELRWVLAGAYRDIVIHNTAVNNLKVKCYEIGLTLLCAAVGFFIVLLTLGGISSGF